MFFMAHRIFGPRLYRWPFIPHQLQSSPICRFPQVAAAITKKSGHQDSQNNSAAPFGTTLLHALAGAACVHILGYRQAEQWSAATEDIASSAGFVSTVPSELLVELRSAVGSERVVLHEGVIDVHSKLWSIDWNRYQNSGRAPSAVVYPRSMDEAAAVVHACHAHKVAIMTGGRDTLTNNPAGSEPGISIDMSSVPLQNGRRSIATKNLTDGLFMVEKTSQSKNVLQHRLDILRIEKEAVVHATKHQLLENFTQQLDPDAAKELRTLFLRVDSTIRAWYKNLFEELLHLYRMFDPVNSEESLEDLECTQEQLQHTEIRFLRLLFYVVGKSNFKVLSDAEADVALAGDYLLSLPITIDDSKLDDTLMPRFFDKYPMEHKPTLSDKYIVFRRGVGIDQVTEHFWMQKLDLLLESMWGTLLWCLGLRERKSWEPIVHDTRGPTDSTATKDTLSIERIHLAGMRLSPKFFTSLTTIQEPTFEHMILIYRPKDIEEEEENEPERSIVVKHFRHIPMADMEIVLPEKKVPGLTKRDAISFGATLVGGALAISTAAQAGLSYSVMGAILAAVGSYCIKLYVEWHANMDTYRALIQQIMYDKQLDSGIGTLLHICDDVVQQELKETMLAYFVLLTQGDATKADLDSRCEQLLERTFGENVQFDVEDAVNKMLQLGIATQLKDGLLQHVALAQATRAIGTTTDEVFGTTNLMGSTTKDTDTDLHASPPLRATVSTFFDIS